MTRPTLRDTLLNRFHGARDRATNSKWSKRLSPLPAILVLALVLRIGYVGGYGHTDISIWSRWIGLIQQHGLFSFYAQHDPANNYPPLAMIGCWIGAAFPLVWAALSDPCGSGSLTNLK